MIIHVFFKGKHVRAGGCSMHMHLGSLKLRAQSANLKCLACRHYKHGECVLGHTHAYTAREGASLSAQLQQSRAS